ASSDLTDRIQIGVQGEPLELHGISRFQSFEPDFGFAWNEKIAQSQSAKSQENPVHRHLPFRRHGQLRHEAETTRKALLYSFPARLLDHLRQTRGIFGGQDSAIALPQLKTAIVIRPRPLLD
ncbi:MAG: hypothetical protein ACJ8B9_18890, partial [Microvirga sp.]